MKLKALFDIQNLPTLIWDVFVRVLFFLILLFQAYQLSDFKRLLASEKVGFSEFQEQHLNEIIRLQQVYRDCYSDYQKDFITSNRKHEDCLIFRQQMRHLTDKLEDEINDLKKRR